MKHDPLLDALAASDDAASVDGALRAIDPDDTRLGERLWSALRTRAESVVRHPSAWRLLAQAPRASFDAVDANLFFRALSTSSLERLEATNRLPWDPSFDTILEKVASDAAAVGVDDDVEPPLRTALRVAMVRHRIAEPERWGADTPTRWLALLLPLWDRFPRYADEFTRLWRVDRYGHLAVRIAADPETRLETTDFLRLFSPYSDPEERVRIVLNVAVPEVLEDALAVLEDDYRRNLEVIFGRDKKWYERVFEDFGSMVIGPHGIVGGPGLLGLVIGFALVRLFDVRFSIFLLTVALTFVLWRLALALSVRPRLGLEECEALASSPLSFGLVAGWVSYRHGLKGKKVSNDLVERFFAGLTQGFPELGRPSRLRTVIEVNLEALEPEEREETVLRVFRADDAIERWAILEFSPTPRVAEAAIDATERFLVSEELGHLSPAPPVAQRALALLASHQQDLFLRALDEGRGAEEVLVFAIGNARGDGVLDSLGRKLGKGGEAMRDAVVTSLANFGAAAIPGVQAGLASSDETTRRDSVEVAWRLPSSRGLTTVISAALASESDPAIARLLAAAQVRHRVAPAFEGVDPLDATAVATAFETALAALRHELTGTRATALDESLLPVDATWSAGSPVSGDAARGFGHVVAAVDPADTRLVPLLSGLVQQLELESRDRWAGRLLAAGAEPIVIVSVAGPATLLRLEASTETIESLARTATPAALLRLESIAHDDPDPGLRRRAFQQLFRAAELRRLRAADLFEHAVSELPPESTVDPAVREVLQHQAARVLHEAMISGHRWRMEKWRSLWADSPLFSALAGRLVWAVYDYGILRQTFRLDEAGDPVDVDDEPIEFEPLTEIGLPVASRFERRLRDRWNLLLADYEIVAPFAQLERETAPKPIDDLTLTAPMLRSLLEHGWYPSTPGLERHYGFLRPFPRLDCTASIEVSPGVGADPDEPQRIDQIGFVEGIHSEFPSISRISPDVPLEAKIQVAIELWEAFGRELGGGRAIGS